MARLITSKCKQCRQTGEKLFIKGDRCFSAKCAMVRKAYVPGARGKNSKGGKTGRGGRRSGSEFGKQLLEKQKIKKIYGVLERQFRKYFDESKTQAGDTRENLVRKLEIRLDNVVFRLKWTQSRSGARQLVNHGHVLVNGKKVDIPSYQVRVGDVIGLHGKIEKSRLMEDLPARIKKQEDLRWLAQNKENISAKILDLPTAEDFGDITPIGLIVEFYSR